VVDGETIPMNHCTRVVMETVVSGVGESLKGVGAKWKKMVVEVVRDDTMD